MPIISAVDEQKGGGFPTPKTFRTRLHLTTVPSLDEALRTPSMNRFRSLLEDKKELHFRETGLGIRQVFYIRKHIDLMIEIAPLPRRIVCGLQGLADSL